MALIGTAFGFIVRAFSIGDWGKEFNLSGAEQGQILGVGFWPFALSIILFSLVIDTIGYKRALYFALFCHAVSGVMTCLATGYWSLYWSTFVFALGSGTVEAVINPVVATMFNKDKAKWLNALHAGWPGGLVLAGLAAIFLTWVGVISWRLKVGLIYIPLVAYGIMMTHLKFPINERVAAGIPYKDMLKEAGGLGALIASALMVSEISRLFGGPTIMDTVWHGSASLVVWAIILGISAGYGVFVKSIGRPMFIFLSLVMIPLATTELGTDGWVTSLMGPEMAKIGLHAGWIIVYTSAIMTLLRFFAGPIVHKLSPLGLLMVCSLLAALGLFSLSKATGIGILAAATLYGVGKSFFWPTMLAVVSERFPRGGALTLNTMGAVGMLGVGMVGAVFMGTMQDKSIDKGLAAYDAKNNTAIHSTYVTEHKQSFFGSYDALDQSKVSTASVEDKAAINTASAAAKLDAFQGVASLPVLMFVCYLGLVLYFRSRGGYKPVDLESAQRAE